MITLKKQGSITSNLINTNIVWIYAHNLQIYQNSNEFKFTWKAESRFLRTEEEFKGSALYDLLWKAFNWSSAFQRITICDHHGGGEGSWQAFMVLKWYMRAYNWSTSTRQAGRQTERWVLGGGRDWQEKGEGLRENVWNERNYREWQRLLKPQGPHPVTHFFPKGRTYSENPSLMTTHSNIQDIFIQTNTQQQKHN